MKYRLLGLAPLLAVAAAHAQSASLQGGMAHPDALKFAQAATPAPAKSAPAPTSATAPTKQGMAAARALATTPGSAPVPYVDFAPAPAPKMGGHMGMMSHHAKPAAKKPTA